MELKTCVTKMGHQSHPYIYNRKQKFSTCPTLDSTPSSEVSSRKLPLIPALSSPKLFTLHRLNDWLQKKKCSCVHPRPMYQQAAPNDIKSQPPPQSQRRRRVERSERRGLPANQRSASTAISSVVCSISMSG